MIASPPIEIAVETPSPAWVSEEEISVVIPPERFWSYLRRRGGSPVAAFQEFRSAVEWVRLNRFRFRSDASSLVDLWDEGES